MTEKTQITKLNKRTLELYLNSPAFLGDAEQKGVWRTPPINLAGARLAGACRDRAR